MEWLAGGAAAGLIAMAGALPSSPVQVQWRRVGGGAGLAGAAGPDRAADWPSPPAHGGFGVDVLGSSRRLVANFLTGDEPLVIGIQDQADREAARRAIREAIAAELLLSSGLPPQRIVLHTLRGKAPWAELHFPDGPRRAWLAISHDGALSVAAISLRGPVGIDVSCIVDIPDWEAVARDYLGPDTAAALALLPPAARTTAFASAWSEREARLKYLGRELVEWNADGDRDLAACRCLPLALPEGYAGMLALPPGRA
jgi:4'-phosphopantetheinyl transferase